MDFEKQRKDMVENQILVRGINDKNLLKAMKKVERHKFVPKNYWYSAYEDFPIPIGEGQTISQPYMIAIMLQLLKLKPSDIVLEIGTGSGYQTALLAEMSDTVCSIERLSYLAEKARKKLEELKYNNVIIKVGDGTKGWQFDYPEIDGFNAIIISAASPKIPKRLTEQLANDGRFVLPYGNRFSQTLIRLTKNNDKLKKEKFGGCVFVPLIGENGWSN